MHDAVGQPEVERAGPAARRRLRLQHAHGETGACEGHGGGQAVGARTDDDGVEVLRHATLGAGLRAAAPARPAGPAALAELELDLLALVERAVAVRLDRAEVHEEVLSTAAGVMNP